MPEEQEGKENRQTMEKELTIDTSYSCRSGGTCATAGCDKLNVHNWLSGMEPESSRNYVLVEVKFKNTRKDFYRNDKGLPLQPGELVVVEGVNGYDIGVVSLTGALVKLQLKKKKCRPDPREYKKILRKPSEEEINKWREAQALEYDTMLKTRVIAAELKLQMKVSDVEYQADKGKATFYYTADDRVDFRELIRILADRFKIRVEMRQIGARQEAGRLGGIGSCGRELCCSSWMTDFRSVSTSSARYQQLAINPLKLAGQCGKLKCCLNFELDAYLDALKGFPSTDIALKTKKGIAFHFKSDIFRGLMWYSYKDDPGKIVKLTAKRASEIIEMNNKGQKPDSLEDFQVQEYLSEPQIEFENVVGQDSLHRFDQKKKRRKSKRRNKNQGASNQSGSGRNRNRKRRSGRNN